MSKVVVGLVAAIGLALTYRSALAESDPSTGEGWISFRPEDFVTVDPSYTNAAQERYLRILVELENHVEKFFQVGIGLGDQYNTRNPRVATSDLNGDGVLEFLYQVRDPIETGFPCRPLCNKPVLIVELVWGENGPNPDPKDYQLVYRGTVFSISTPSFRDDVTDMYLFAEPNPHSDWRSLTTGPRQVHPTKTHLGRPLAFGGDRYCWTDRPQAIDLSRFNWRRSQEDIRLGFDYEEGQEGYFLRIPYDQECPE